MKRPSQRRSNKKKQSRSLKKHIIYGLTVLLICAGLTIYFVYFHNVEISKPELYSLQPTEQMDSRKKISFEDFTGSESCKECHTEQYDKWKSSTHAKAGGAPGNVKIIARFDSKPLKFKDAIVFPKVTREGKYVFDVIKEDKTEFRIGISAVVGGGHLYGGGGQSFFAGFPDGSLRCLPFEFISKENIWYVALKNLNWVPVTNDISLGDLDNWIPHKFLGTNCQNCHGSQIIIEKDPKQNRYRTRFKTLSINCESCHGPGRKHIELVKSTNFNGSDNGMEILATVSKDKSLGICFQCHAIKHSLNDGYLPGDDFDRFYSLKQPITMTEVYTDDGRINQFGYQQNHLFSDCYVNGSMTCVDCHDPHDQSYRNIFGESLSGKFDNGQCTGCHASKAEFPELHTKHKRGSSGNLCTSCHMPFLQHRIIGDKLTLARSDHAIPIPRPTFDNNLGIQNACSKCHEDKTISDLQKDVNEMWGKIKPHNTIISDIIRSAGITDINVASDLLLKPEINHPISQFTGLSTFARRFLKPDMQIISTKILIKLKALAQNKDIDIKSFSLMCLHLSSGNSSEINGFLYEQLRKNINEEDAIRLRWADALYQLGHSFMLKKEYSTAIIIFSKAVEIRPYSTILWNILGLAYMNQNNYTQSIQSYNESISLDSYNTYAYLNIADVYFKLGDKNKALEYLNTVLKYDPENIEAKRISKEHQNQQ